MTANPLAADYSLHDHAYGDLIARGERGWNQPDEYRQMLDQFRLILPMAPPARTRLLELGCGMGNFSAMLAQEGYLVTGVDVAPTAIAWAKRELRSNGDEVDFVVGDVVTLAGMGDDRFDVVVDGHCLHCIIGADRAMCLQNVRRVLKPGGVFAVMSMCGEVVNPRIREWFDPESRTVWRDGKPTRYIGLPGAICDELRAAGFAIDWVQTVARRAPFDQDDLLIRARS